MSKEDIKKKVKFKNKKKEKKSKLHQAKLM